MNLTMCKWMLLVVVIRLGFGSALYAAEELDAVNPEKEQLAAIEQNVGGRLGVALLDTGN
ncbi:MAG: hypothetical protein JO271_10830, partial [Verrucomicrobia bacterium]|nr:hypothetical protein [Verrucomicrobiota bacterium]